MTKDLVIDGAAVAARIVGCLPVQEQERLVESVRELAPTIATKIETKMYNFERIGTLKKQKLQSLLQDVTPRDLAISLKNTGESVREAILDNVSETKLKMVQEDFSSLPPMKVDDVEAAQHRILKRLEELYPEESPMPVARSLKNRTA